MAEALGVSVGGGVVRGVGVPASAGLEELQGEGEGESEACDRVAAGVRDCVGLTETQVVREKEGEEEAEGQGVEEALPPPPLQGVPDTLGLASMLPEAVAEGVREGGGVSVPPGVCVAVGAGVRESVPLTVPVGCVETVWVAVAQREAGAVAEAEGVEASVGVALPRVPSAVTVGEGVAAGVPLPPRAAAPAAFPVPVAQEEVLGEGVGEAWRELLGRAVGEAVAPGEVVAVPVAPTLCVSSAVGVPSAGPESVAVRVADAQELRVAAGAVGVGHCEPLALGMPVGLLGGVALPVAALEALGATLREVRAPMDELIEGVAVPGPPPGALGEGDAVPAAGLGVPLGHAEGLAPRPPPLPVALCDAALEGDTLATALWLAVPV